MKISIAAGVIALTFTLSSGTGIAQSVTIDLNPEQRTRIKEYVVKERVPRATVKERVTIGGTVPADVELRDVPADWGPSVRAYRYYYSDGGIDFVDSDRRVVYGID